MRLPKGWASSKLGDVADINPKHPADTDRDQVVSFVPMPAVDEFLGSITAPLQRAMKEIWTGYTHFADGDVIFAKITPCMENGKAAVVAGMLNGLACGSTEFFVLRPNGAAEASYIWRYVRQPSFRADAEQNMSGAVGQRRVPRPYLESRSIPLPPKAEQRRIIVKLDALTARLARARAELDRVPMLTARLRKQALSGALEGLLSVSTQNGWSHDDLHALHARRIAYLRSRRGSRLRSDLADTITWLNGPRSGWLNCRLADVITLRVGYAFKSADFSKIEGVPLLRGANIAPGRVDWTDQVRLRAGATAPTAAYTLDAGDIVIAMDRPIISAGLKIARVAESDAGSLLVQRVANPRPTMWIDPSYLMAVLQSDLFMQQIDNHATGTDLPHISGNDILTTPCPLPPLSVQKRIVDIINAAFTRADHLEVEAARARALLDRLESAILAKAFRGELLPQDPNDEPANVLLERIRAERAAPAKRRGRAAKATA